VDVYEHLTDFVLAPEAGEPAEGPIHHAVQDILFNIGEDPQRQGLLKTPDRVARMYAELTSGYHIDPEKLINGALFDVEYNEMVLVKDIEFYSLCEHHMLPLGMLTAYLPQAKSLAE
jgi:GTP cyclohydrolase I